MPRGIFGKSLTTGYERIMEEGPERIATVLNYIGEKLEKGRGTLSLYRGQGSNRHYRGSYLPDLRRQRCGYHRGLSGHGNLSDQKPRL